MSDPDSQAAAPDPVELRAALRARIAAEKSEQGRLAALLQGRDRAAEEQRPVRARLREAEAVLASAVRDEKINAAYAFLNNSFLEDPIGTARTQVDTIQVEVDKLEGIENALTEEISRVQANLRSLRNRTVEAKATLLSHSPELLALVTLHRNTWVQLRSIKAALRAINTAVRVPYGFEHEADLVEPLEPGVSRGNLRFHTDLGLATEWQEALAALETNADTQLPGAAPVTLTRPAPPVRPAPLRSVPLMRSQPAAPEAATVARALNALAE